MQKCNGYVSNFNFGSNGVGGYGFIQSDQVVGDVYFKRLDLPEDLQNFGYNQVVKGCHVTFDLTHSPGGKPQGVNIKLAPVDGEPLVGTVASYSNINRYGFIVCPFTEDKVYFQQKELPPTMQDIDGNRLKGQTVQFKLELKPDGKPWGKDIKLHKMIMPKVQQAAVPAPVKRAMVSAMVPVSKKPRTSMGMSMKLNVKQQASAAQGTGPRKTGVVRSYNKIKGFGFIGSPGVPQGDVYFQRVSLSAGGDQDVAPGRKVSFNLIHTPEGRPQGTNVMLN